MKARIEPRACQVSAVGQSTQRTLRALQHGRVLRKVVPRRLQQRHRPLLPRRRLARRIP